ncbi:MAG: alpha-ketoacid dehydrogenase subunit beta [Thermodesulfobacteriota bacterium]
MPWTKISSDKSEFEKLVTVSDTPLRGLTYSEALLEAQIQLLSNDERVIVMGEGVDDAGGVFGTTKGLQEDFGEARVFDTPLAENGLTGIAIGAALAGLRPIFVHMRVDFMPLTLDQILNHASKWHYMFGGAVNVPLVIRSIIGRGWGSAAQHSQSLQSLFANIPGLKVVMPTTPHDAKGMLMAASDDGNPVIFIEHRWLYGHMGHVPEEPYKVEIDKGIVRREGTDVTIVALSHMVFEAIQAARALAEEGIEAEIVDLRTIRPLDMEIILTSIKKTGRLVVADTGWKTGGIGAEIIAGIIERDPGLLKKPVKRVNPPDVPTPASHVLEEAFYPGKDDIIEAVKELIE